MADKAVVLFCACVTRPGLGTLFNSVNKSLDENNLFKELPVFSDRFKKHYLLVPDIHCDLLLVLLASMPTGKGSF